MGHIVKLTSSSGAITTKKSVHIVFSNFALVCILQTFQPEMANYPPNV